MLIDVSKDDPRKIIHFRSDFASRSNQASSQRFSAESVGFRKRREKSENGHDIIGRSNKRGLWKAADRRSIDRRSFPVRSFLHTFTGFRTIAQFREIESENPPGISDIFFSIRMWAAVGRVTFRTDCILIGNCINLFMLNLSNYKC